MIGKIKPIKRNKGCHLRRLKQNIPEKNDEKRIRFFKNERTKKSLCEEVEKTGNHSYGR
jgi:hypothetical protein